jgi:hypothetical protein
MSKNQQYQGSFVYNKFHGEGVLTNEQGTYEGNFESGHKQGPGTMFYKNGNVFRGSWQYNMFTEGEMTLDDSTRLDGVWRHHNSGAGTITFPNGDLYQGEWTNFAPHRTGKYILKTGKIYTGELKEGRKHGAGTLQYPNGDIYEGQFVDDLRSGFGKLTFKKGGESYEGEWQND